MLKRLLRWAGLAASAFGLAGCYVAPAPMVALPGQGKTYQQFQADDNACRPATSTHAPIPGAAPAPTNTAPPTTTYNQATGPDLFAQDHSSYLQCMAAHGNNMVQVPRAYPYP